jgi:hypothetical protein
VYYQDMSHHRSNHLWLITNNNNHNYKCLWQWVEIL